MRILSFVFLLFALSGLHSFRPGEKTPALAMCHDPGNAVAAFAAFADDRAFRDMHPSPLPTETVHQGEMIEFPVTDGPNGRAFLIKSHHATDKYLMLFHEWWGLNDYVKREASMWSHELGINVIAVDLYDGKVTASAEEAGKLMQACDAKRATAIIEGAAKYAGDAADFRTLGWCFGGGWSLQGALALKDKVKACVMYYGMPEKDVEKLKTLGTDVVFIHPKQDKWITDELVTEFENNMKAAGKTVTVHHYDADHAFANPSSPRYNDTAARESRKVVKEYLKGK